MKLIDKRFWILLIPIIIISCNGNSKEGGAESAESNLTVFGQTKDFEHHAFLIGDTLYCSAVEASGYNDFHGCKTSDIYNIVVPVILKPAMKGIPLPITRHPCRPTV